MIMRCLRHPGTHTVAFDCLLSTLGAEVGRWCQDTFTADSAKHVRHDCVGWVVVLLLQLGICLLDRRTASGPLSESFLACTLREAHSLIQVGFCLDLLVSGKLHNKVVVLGLTLPQTWVKIDLEKRVVSMKYTGMAYSVKLTAN